jgi:predicted membrane protein
VEYINKAESERELVIIEKISRENSLYSGGNENRQHERYAESRGDSESDDGKTSFALLSTRHLSGDFFTGENHSLFSILGSHEIDFAEGELPNGRTEITIVSLLGDTKIRVPPNVKVKINAVPILGEAKVARNIENVPSYGPELVINGIAILSSINVKYIDKNKRGKKAWF